MAPVAGEEARSLPVERTSNAADPARQILEDLPPIQGFSEHRQKNGEQRPRIVSDSTEQGDPRSRGFPSPQLEPFEEKPRGEEARSKVEVVGYAPAVHEPHGPEARVAEIELDEASHGLVEAAAADELRRAARVQPQRVVARHTTSAPPAALLSER